MLIGVGGPTAFEYTNTAEFCSSCHQMDNEFVSWKASEHAPEVTCINCHSDPGALGELAAHVGGARMLYYAIAEISPNLVMSEVIKNENCTKCHLMDDELARGMKVEHIKHLDKGVSCQDCHAGLVHKAHEPRLDAQFHATCQNCHESKGLVLKTEKSTSCNACHTDLSRALPKDHAPDWLSKHGAEAKKNQNCGQCHLANSAGAHGPMSKPAFFQTTRPDDECMACHKGNEMPHPASYLSKHGGDALKLGGESCATCHSSQNKANPKAKYAADNFCASCHSGVTMPHAKNFLSQHGDVAGTTNNTTCLVCHSSANRVNPTAKYAANNFCSSCHAGVEMPHTTQFTATHGQQALKNGLSCRTCHSELNPVAPKAAHASGSYCAACHNESKHQEKWVSTHGAKADQVCFTCHSQEPAGKNSCQACHNGNPAEQRLFHSDPYWWLNHKVAARAQGEASCAKCHAEVKPSCTQCHANR